MNFSHIACSTGNLAICELLDEFGVDWNESDSLNNTPLFYAISSRNISLITYLQTKNINLEHMDNQNRTPFYWACHLGFLPVIQHLYNSGCNPNTKSKLGRTPLSKCAFLGLTDIVVYLLSLQEVDVHVLDNKMRTSLHQSCWGAKGGPDGKKHGSKVQTDSPQIGRLLMDNGIDVNA